ncbi:MAG TPA: EamA family transporter RarD [Thermomicrobiales bacterium]|nr:EamA family transporter RarD [Thermomicrobiales bacterium]
MFGLAAYGMWGVFPIYFKALAPAGSLEILAHRVVWSFLVCTVIWILRRDLSWVRPLIAVPHRLALLILAAVLLALNWLTYIHAVNSGNVVESSLGYFINPLVLVLLGVTVLHEHLRPLQWTAVGIGVIAVSVISWDYGRLPWIALVLASSFAAYGFIKKKVGTSVEALPSMTVESAVLTPPAIAILAWIAGTGRGTFTHDAPWHALLLAMSGVFTTGPLVCFAAAARRVPLTTMGLMQFVAPVLQLLIGVLVFGERVTAVRWFGFGLVWVALACLSFDSVHHAHSTRQRRT